MHIAVIGAGAIAGYLTRAIAADPGLHLVGRITRSPQPGAVTRVADLPRCDLLVDCAGHSGLAAHGAEALAKGLDVLTLSLGALADAALAQTLTRAATEGGSILHLASGAIGALDALRAARVGGLERVIYTGRKPPRGWLGSPAEAALNLSTLTHPATHFTGTARQAALRYPKNANVAAAVALAGLGFDATEVSLIADPAAPGNIHEIKAKGAFGSFHFTITGTSLPDTPRSSALAAMSALAAIRQAQSPLRFT